jgi:hypothetical protein
MVNKLAKQFMNEKGINEFTLNKILNTLHESHLDASETMRYLSVIMNMVAATALDKAMSISDIKDMDTEALYNDVRTTLYNNDPYLVQIVAVLADLLEQTITRPSGRGK